MSFSADWLLAVGGAIVVLILVVRTLPFFYDYRISREGVDLMVFRVMRVRRLRRRDIACAKVIPWWRALPFTGVALGNRLVSKGLAINLKHRLLIRRWYITPKDPFEAARVLTEGQNQEVRLRAEISE